MTGVPSGCLPQLWLRFRLSLVPFSLFNTPNSGIITVACGLPFVYMLGRGLSPVSITLPICCKNFWVQEMIPCCWICIDHNLTGFLSPAIIAVVMVIVIMAMVIVTDAVF